MEEKKKHEVASPQKLMELQHSDLESFYRQPDEEVKKEQVEDCPECCCPQVEEEEKKKQAQECVQYFYQPEKPEAGDNNN